MSTMILWTKIFMEAQGYDIRRNIIYQDNKFTILLKTNGKRSSSNRTKSTNIHYFFLTYQIQKGNLTVEYCPTTEIIADFMIKPLQGKLFQKFRKMIMSHMNVLILYLERQNCVGQLNNRTTDSRQTPKRNNILYTHLGLIQLIIDCVR